MQLGMKSIPSWFVRFCMHKGLHQAFSDAGTSLSKAPGPWEVVEVEQKGGGFQPLDVPFQSSAEEPRRQKKATVA